MTSQQIIFDSNLEPLRFKGELLGYADGEPYPDMDNYHEYAVYRRDEDGYFVCVNYSTSEIKAVETEKQVVDFFGLDPIAKILFERIGISIDVVISTFEDGAGDYFQLVGADDRNYSLVGKLVHRSLINESNDIHEVYKLNTKGYISTVLNYRGHTQVELLDEYELTTMFC